MVGIERPIYEENLSSAWTTVLFEALAMLFGGLWYWQVTAGRSDSLTALLGFLGGMFFFYMLNYRVLRIRVDPEAIRLRFGILGWTVPAENIAEARLDEIPPFYRYGGAGIHFMTVDRRYRVSMNFLEHPRVVVALKRPCGLVREVSFSTRRPEAVLAAIGEVVAAGEPQGKES